MTGPVESSGKSLLLMAIYVLIGAPLVGYLWDVLNDVLALHVEPTRLLIGAAVAVVLVFYLRFVSGKIRSSFQAPETG